MALDLASRGDIEKGQQLADAEFQAADNMTDRMAALSVIVQQPGEARERALAAFEKRYAGDALVMDKWFALNATLPERENP